MLDQLVKGKRGIGGLVYCAWFLSRFKSRKGTTLQCGQSHKEILPWKLLTLKEWA